MNYLKRIWSTITGWFEPHPSPIYIVTEEIHQLLDRFENNGTPYHERIKQLKTELVRQQAYLIHYGIDDAKIIEHTRYVYSIIVRYSTMKYRV